MRYRSHKPVLIKGFALLAIIVLGFWFFSVNKNGAVAEQQGQAPQAMPVQVTVIEPVKKQLWHEFSARTEAIEFAEIRPQISGRITDIKFQDGQLVEKGDILYVIDPRPFEAALNQAQAELRSARSEADLAKKELKRAEELIQTSVISQRVLDERKSRRELSLAAIEKAKASIEQAKINLDYAYVKAPISGRIGRAEIKVGNLVEANINAPVLTSIVATDRMFADFEIDEQTYLSFVRSIAQSPAETSGISVPVKLYLNGDNALVYDGVIDSFDNRIDVSNGTIRARAIFDNQDSVLIPGMFAKVRVGTPNTQDLILVSETAIGTDQDRKFVYVVDENNIVKYREVKTGESQKGQRVITQGLKAGDKVITTGLMRLRPEMPVDPKIEDENQLGAAPSASSS